MSPVEGAKQLLRGHHFVLWLTDAVAISQTRRGQCFGNNVAGTIFQYDLSELSKIFNKYPHYEKQLAAKHQLLSANALHRVVCMVSASGVEEF